MMARIVPVTFTGANGDELAARLDLPDGEPTAFALFAHCFTCSKDIAAATRISRGLVAEGFGAGGVVAHLRDERLDPNAGGSARSDRRLRLEDVAPERQDHDGVGTNIARLGVRSHSSTCRAAAPTTLM